MRFALKVTEKGTGLEQLRRALGEASNLAAFVGVLGSDGGELATIALVHEFGSPAHNIPERSYLRSTFAAQQKQLGAMAERLAKRLYEGKGNAEQALGLMGMHLAQEVKRTIVNRIPPPLKPATIARKGSDVPLVDTGQLLNSITWVVHHAEPGETEGGTP